MNEGKISVRYSKATFAIAKEQNKLDSLKKDMELILQVVEIPEFKDFLQNPVILVSQKQNICRAIFGDKVDKITLDTLLLMVKNRREIYLKLFALNFLKLYRDFYNITEVELTTAVEVNEQIRTTILNLLKSRFSSKIDLKTKTNPDLIGGFIVRVDDKQLDASVKGQLQKFKKELIK